MPGDEIDQWCGVLSDDAQLEALKEYVVSGLRSGELRHQDRESIPPLRRS
jgi:hypothetical protein